MGGGGGGIARCGGARRLSWFIREPLYRACAIGGFLQRSDQPARLHAYMPASVVERHSITCSRLVLHLLSRLSREGYVGDCKDLAIGCGTTRAFLGYITTLMHSIAVVKSF